MIKKRYVALISLLTLVLGLIGGYYYGKDSVNCKPSNNECKVVTCVQPKPKAKVKPKKVAPKKVVKKRVKKEEPKRKLRAKIIRTWEGTESQVMHSVNMYQQQQIPK